jgi:anti-sigma factor RsiW
MMTHASPSGIPCIEVVELVRDYLDGALDPELRERVERHLAVCPPCLTYIEQIRQTAVAVGELAVDSLDPAVVEELEAAFRDFHRPR